MSNTKHTPGPWLDAVGNWLYEPQKLLTEPANAWLMGTAPDLLTACEALVYALDHVMGDDISPVHPHGRSEIEARMGLDRLNYARRDACLAIDKAEEVTPEVSPDGESD